MLTDVLELGSNGGNRSATANGAGQLRKSVQHQLLFHDQQGDVNGLGGPVEHALVALRCLVGEVAVVGMVLQPQPMSQLQEEFLGRLESANSKAEPPVASSSRTNL